MFDDPKKELQRLQEQLLAVEAEEDEPDWEPEDDPDQALLDVRTMLARDDWEESERQPLYLRYTQEEPQPEYEIPREPVPKSRSQQKQKADPGRIPKGSAVLILLLEALGLCCLTAWWLLWR